jgi:hypothetical protein
MRTSWPIVSGAFRPLALALVASLALVVACNDPTDSAGGTIRLSVTTVGPEADGDGYFSRWTQARRATCP